MIGAGPGDDRISLDYEARLVRRKRLISDTGRAFIVDLAETTSLSAGQCFDLDDGTAVEVVAAPERLLVVQGDLARLAWHIGNRHTPCQIEADRLLIRDDHVLRAMLERLGAAISEETAPFLPEGGAYGHGRTFPHSHGPRDAHDHGHGTETAGDTG